MYPIELEKLLDHSKLNEKILYIGCISFEERSIAAYNIIFNKLSKIDIEYCFINLVDNKNDYAFNGGNSFKNQCEAEKEKWFLSINMKGVAFDDIEKIELIDNLVEEKIILFFEKLINGLKNLRTIIFDITCFTKSTYIPLLKFIFTDYSALDLIVVYTQPIKYGTELKCEPLDPGFNLLHLRKQKKLIWIPILGFKPDYTKLIWEIMQTESNLYKVIPILGFPAFRPDFFDKSLILHGKKFETDERFKIYLKEPLYAEANNPFNIYYKLLKIKDTNLDSEIVCSPLGSKPMALGLTLFAIIHDYPIISIQSKVYYPDYSIGYLKTEAYIIKKDGRLFF